ncbi:MAG: hypothetical protein RMK62_00975 [Armatimonadota bacterium]|nr:hypothetical protein [Armatimonadota bacterium]
MRRWAWLVSLLVGISAGNGLWSQGAPPTKGALLYRESVGRVWLIQPAGQKVPFGVKGVATGAAAIETAQKSTAVLHWAPYAALVKMAGDTMVRLEGERALKVERGRIWVGSPPPPPPLRRYPLPVFAGDLLVVGTHDAIFSVLVTPKGLRRISVDQGACEVFLPTGSLRLPSGMMVDLIPSEPVRPIISPLSYQEKLLWDSGGF